MEKRCNIRSVSGKDKEQTDWDGRRVSQRPCHESTISGPENQISHPDGADMLECRYGTQRVSARMGRVGVRGKTARPTGKELVLASSDPGNRHLGVPGAGG